MISILLLLCRILAAIDLATFLSHALLRNVTNSLLASTFATLVWSPVSFMLIFRSHTLFKGIAIQKKDKHKVLCDAYLYAVQIIIKDESPE